MTDDNGTEITAEQAITAACMFGFAIGFGSAMLIACFMVITFMGRCG